MPIYERRLAEGFLRPCSVQDVAKVLSSVPDEFLKGPKGPSSVNRFYNPSNFRIAGELGQSGDNGLMDADVYPGFADLYSGYFHQDWRLEDSSADDLVTRYRQSQPQDVDRLKDELSRLVATNLSEEVLRAELGPFTFYDPDDDGLTVHAWIRRLLELLDAPIE